jgi:hypothetical protein
MSSSQTSPCSSFVHHDEDIRHFGGTRYMDIIMYVLYSNDQCFVQDMVSKVTLEVAAEYECKELEAVTTIQSNLLLYKCLFFLMLNFHSKFRYWVLKEVGLGLQPVCPHKATRFLKILRNDLIPSFLVNESMSLMEFEHALKVEYVRS